MSTGERLTPEDESRLRQDLPTWRRIRRYAVPPEMIAAATAARLAGDWAGACRAARMSTSVDLDQVRNRYGDEAAGDILDALTHFAPDLLRWHLPRVLGGRTSLGTRSSVILSTGDDSDGPLLRVRLPYVVDGSQRLRLDVVTRADLADEVWSDLPRHLWDVRRTHELAAAWGLADRPTQPPAETDVLHAAAVDANNMAANDEETDDETTDDVHTGEGDAGYLHLWRRVRRRSPEAGDVVGAWRAAGIEFDPDPPDSSNGATRLADFGAYPLWPVGLAREARRLSGKYRVTEVLATVNWRARAVLSVHADGRVTARIADRAERLDLVQIGVPVMHRPADLDLLQYGLIEPADLHPRIGAALFPDMSARPPSGPTAVPRPAPVSVRCHGEWHQVQVVDGRIRALSHRPEEEEREALLRALGGTSTGCFATLRAWTEGTGRLPRRLNDQRRDLLLRMLHGETEQMVAMLDAGHLDPHFRDSRGWTMLHLLTQLDHEELLPRLLAAGVDLETRDGMDRTPLYLAVTAGASTELIHALWLAGADPHSPCQYDATAIDALDRDERADRIDRDIEELDFLRHPRPAPADPTDRSIVDAFS